MRLNVRTLGSCVPYCLKLLCGFLAVLVVGVALAPSMPALAGVDDKEAMPQCPMPMLQLIDAGRFQRALDVPDSAITSSTDTRYARLTCHYVLGQFKNALDDATLILKSPQVPDSPFLDGTDPRLALYELRAHSLIKLGRFDQAVADLTAALKLNPNDAGLYAFRAFAYKKSGDRQHAATDIQKLEQLDPQVAEHLKSTARHDTYQILESVSPQFLSNLNIRFYQHTGVPLREAVLKATASQRTSDKWNSALRSVEAARESEIKGDWDRAIAQYQNAVKIDENNGAILASLGLCYFTRFAAAKEEDDNKVQSKTADDLRSAIQTLKTAAAKSPDDWTVWNDLGAIEFYTGSGDDLDSLVQARQAFAKALSVPEDKVPAFQQRYIRNAMNVIAMVLAEKRNRADNP